MKRIHDIPEGGGGNTLIPALRTTLVALFALIGVLCLAVVAMPLVGLQLIVLTTGSMSPGLPAGSLVIARDAAAREISVGDVVTVGREGKPPVTHRVISVGAGVGEQRTIEMQGDGNATPDPEPYVVERVGIAVFGAPWGGQLVFAMRSPWAIGGAAVVVALLVLWSWWPTEQQAEE